MSTKVINTPKLMNETLFLKSISNGYFDHKMPPEEIVKFTSTGNISPKLMDYLIYLIVSKQNFLNHNFIIVTEDFLQSPNQKTVFFDSNTLTKKFILVPKHNESNNSWSLAILHNIYMNFPEKIFCKHISEYISENNNKGSNGIKLLLPENETNKENIAKNIYTELEDSLNRYYHNNENSRNQLVVQYCFINNASNSGKAILEFIKEMIENKNGTEDYVNSVFNANNRNVKLPLSFDRRLVFDPALYKNYKEKVEQFNLYTNKSPMNQTLFDDYGKNRRWFTTMQPVDLGRPKPQNVTMSYQSNKAFRSLPKFNTENTSSSVMLNSSNGFNNKNNTVNYMKRDPNQTTKTVYTYPIKKKIGIEDDSLLISSCESFFPVSIDSTELSPDSQKKKGTNQQYTLRPLEKSVVLNTPSKYVMSPTKSSYQHVNPKYVNMPKNYIKTQLQTPTEIKKVTFENSNKENKPQTRAPMQLKLSQEKHMNNSYSTGNIIYKKINLPKGLNLSNSTSVQNIPHEQISTYNFNHRFGDLPNEYINQSGDVYMKTEPDVNEREVHISNLSQSFNRPINVPLNKSVEITPSNTLRRYNTSRTIDLSSNPLFKKMNIEPNRKYQSISPRDIEVRSHSKTNVDVIMENEDTPKKEITYTPKKIGSATLNRSKEELGRSIEKLDFINRKRSNDNENEEKEERKSRSKKKAKQIEDNGELDINEKKEEEPEKEREIKITLKSKRKGTRNDRYSQVDDVVNQQKEPSIDDKSKEPSVKTEIINPDNTGRSIEMHKGAESNGERDKPSFEETIPEKEIIPTNEDISIRAPKKPQRVKSKKPNKDNTEKEKEDIKDLKYSKTTIPSQKNDIKDKEERPMQNEEKGNKAFNTSKTYNPLNQPISIEEETNQKEYKPSKTFLPKEVINEDEEVNDSYKEYKPSKTYMPQSKEIEDDVNMKDSNKEEPEEEEGIERAKNKKKKNRNRYYPQNKNIIIDDEDEPEAKNDNNSNPKDNNKDNTKDTPTNINQDEINDALNTIMKEKEDAESVDKKKKKRKNRHKKKGKNANQDTEDKDEEKMNEDDNADKEDNGSSDKKEEEPITVSISEHKDVSKPIVKGSINKEDDNNKEDIEEKEEESTPSTNQNKKRRKNKHKKQKYQQLNEDNNDDKDKEEPNKEEKELKPSKTMMPISKEIEDEPASNSHDKEDSLNKALKPSKTFIPKTEVFEEDNQNETNKEKPEDSSNKEYKSSKTYLPHSTQKEDSNEEPVVLNKEDSPKKALNPSKTYIPSHKDIIDEENVSSKKEQSQPEYLASNEDNEDDSPSNVNNKKKKKRNRFYPNKYNTESSQDDRSDKDIIEKKNTNSTNDVQSFSSAKALHHITVPNIDIIEALDIILREKQKEKLNQSMELKEKKKKRKHRRKKKNQDNNDNNREDEDEENNQKESEFVDIDALVQEVEEAGTKKKRRKKNKKKIGNIEDNKDENDNSPITDNNEQKETLEEKIEKEPSEVTLTDTKNPVNTEDDVVNTNEVQEKENKVDDANEDNINQGNKEDENDNNEDTNIVESNENEDETKNKKKKKRRNKHKKKKNQNVIGVSESNNNNNDNKECQPVSDINKDNKEYKEMNEEDNTPLLSETIELPKEQLIKPKEKIQPQRGAHYTSEKPIKEKEELSDTKKEDKNYESPINTKDIEKVLKSSKTYIPQSTIEDEETKERVNKEYIPRKTMVPVEIEMNEDNKDESLPLTGNKKDNTKSSNDKVYSKSRTAIPGKVNEEEEPNNQLIDQPLNEMRFSNTSLPRGEEIDNVNNDKHNKPFQKSKTSLPSTSKTIPNESTEPIEEAKSFEDKEKPIVEEIQNKEDIIPTVENVSIRAPKKPQRFKNKKSTPLTKNLNTKDDEQEKNKEENEEPESISKYYISKVKKAKTVQEKEPSMNESNPNSKLKSAKHSQTMKIHSTDDNILNKEKISSQPNEVEITSSMNEDKSKSLEHSQTMTQSNDDKSSQPIENNKIYNKSKTALPSSSTPFDEEDPKDKEIIIPLIQNEPKTQKSSKSYIPNSNDIILEENEEHDDTHIHHPKSTLQDKSQVKKSKFPVKGSRGIIDEDFTEDTNKPLITNPSINNNQPIIYQKRSITQPDNTNEVISTSKPERVKATKPNIRLGRGLDISDLSDEGNLIDVDPVQDPNDVARMTNFPMSNKPNFNAKYYSTNPNTQSQYINGNSLIDEFIPRNTAMTVMRMPKALEEVEDEDEIIGRAKRVKGKKKNSKEETPNIEEMTKKEEANEKKEINDCACTGAGDCLIF